MSHPDIDGPTHVAVAGKSARRSAKPTFMHLVEVWDVVGGLILGQRSVPEDGHELTTFWDVLATLDLTGAVVTLDAAGCQTETLDLIRERGGEYVVCVKGNQPTLRDAIAVVFDRAAESEFVGCDGHASVTDAHGRHEERNVTVVQNPDGLPAGWAGVGNVALVCQDRRVKGKGNEGTDHYHLSSQRVGVAELAGHIRRHWHIEAMHGGLDVTFREDESRTRTGHAVPTRDGPTGGRFPAQAGRDHGPHAHPTAPGRMGRPIHGSSDPGTLHVACVSPGTVRATTDEWP